MANYFPPTPVYPKNYDSDYTLFLVYNTAETITTVEDMPWAAEISIRPVDDDANEIWADNGFANIDGELFYYDSVEKNGAGKIVKFKRCARNLGGTHTKHTNAGAEVRGYVIAEHHNQIIDAILKIEDFVGENNSTDIETLDYRIRHLDQLPVIFDDYTCPDITFDYYIVSDDPATGITIQYIVVIDGSFTSYRLDFGDGEFTTTSTKGTHRYSPNATIDPIISVANSKCTIVQSPVERTLATEPTGPVDNGGFEIKVPTIPNIPPVIIPTIPDAPPIPPTPPIVFPCLDIGTIGPISIPSIIVVEPPIEIPSLILIQPTINIPSLITVIAPSIPTIITVIDDIPTLIGFGPVEIPTLIGFSPVTIPTLINFGASPLIPTLVNFGTAPLIPTMVNFGPAPTVASLVEFGPAPIITSLIEFGPAPEIATLIEFGPAPFIATLVEFGPAPDIATLIDFGPAPDIATLINFGPAPDIVSLVEFGAAPIIPTLINFGPAPLLPTLINFGAAPIIPTLINFGPAPLLPTLINFGPAPVISVAWGTPPTLSCVVSVSCPSEEGPFARSSKQKFETFGPLDPVVSLSVDDVSIPSEIIMKLPDIPDVKITHDLPSIIHIESPIIPDINIIASNLPKEIKLNVSDLPSVIELVSYNLPKSIPLDFSGLPTSIKLAVPDSFPSIKIDASGMPSGIQVIGIPQSIALVGPSEIKLVMPDKPEIEMVYKGSPIDVKISLDINRLTGDDGSAQCVAIVPCGR